jgi:hypothetical protein
MILFLISTLLIGCVQQMPEEEIKKEQIAIETAIAEGYRHPKLFTKYGMETNKAVGYLDNQ